LNEEVLMKKLLFTFLVLFCMPTLAIAGQSALFFIEMEHEDSDSQELEEIFTIASLNNLLASSYDKLYWLDNEDATKDGFFLTLQGAVTDWNVVDVYLVVHGGMQYFWGHFNDRVYTDDILSLGSFPGMDNLRLVYVGTCHGWDLTDEFLESGADCAVGSPEKMVNFPFLLLFANAFANQGYSAGDAVSSSVMYSGQFKVNGNKSITMNTGN
jgi:hypothetical protein